MITNNDAIFELSAQYHPNIGIYISGGSETDLSGVTLENGSLLAFTFDDVLVKKAELEAAEPLRQLRIQRNRLLAQTDWRMTTDYPYNDQTAWATYRTELRDLPATASPTLDENGQLTNVVWPTPPSDL